MIVRSNSLEQEIEELQEKLIPMWPEGSHQRLAYEQRLAEKLQWLRQLRGEIGND